MICLKCGYCCTTTCVVIVVDPEIGIKDGNLKAVNNLKDLCPHLRGNEVGKYSCAVHDRPWYPLTPCFSHGQIESSPDDLCRMGEYLLKKLPRGLDNTIS